MFWHDIKDIQINIQKINLRLFQIEEENKALKQLVEDGDKFTTLSDRIDEMYKAIVNICDFEDEDNLFPRMMDKLNVLTDDERRNDQVKLSLKTVDKFEDYMKNVDKLNLMINEFKGCISMARGAFNASKKTPKARKKATAA